MNNENRQRTIIDLPRYIKYAREASILGNYEKSLKIYSKIIKIIKKRIEFELKDPYIIDRWKSAEMQLKAEVALVVKANNTCMLFQQEELEQFARIERENEKNNQILMRDYKVAKRPVRDDEDRWAYFGGQSPFSYLDENNKYKDDEYSYKNSGGGFNKKDEFKDPDVWDPPDDNPRFPLKKAQSKPIKNWNCNNNKNDNNNNYKPPNVDVEKKRNYEKPWKMLENNKKNKDKDKEPVKDQIKSAFLLNRYPDDGVGPDSDLIEMIEREVVETTPNVSFDDIAELENAKKTLQEAVILPLLMPDFFQGIRRPWKGVLLFGPPGTGKTLLARALATQGKTTFFNVSATTFASKWRGESEKLVRLLFEMARFYAPSTIFIDEVDSIGTKRSEGDNEATRRVMAEMLVQMDGIMPSSNDDSTKPSSSSSTTTQSVSVSSSISKVDPNKEKKAKIVMVLAATNHPWDLDDALRRRFEKRVYIPLPNKIGRDQMFKINLKGIQLAADIHYAELIKNTDGYSGADIANVCREAALMQMRRKLLKNSGGFDLMSIVNNPEFQNDLEAPVTQKDILSAIKNISRSVGTKDLVKYEQWTKEFSNQ